MANSILCTVLLGFLNLLITISAQSENLITAIDSNEKRYIGNAVVSPGQWIEMKCPHTAPFKWSKSSFSNGSSPVKFDSEKNNPVLNISDIGFTNAGIYYCEKDAQYPRFLLTVIAITKTVNGTVPITTISSEMNGLEISQQKLNEKSKVNVSCFCDQGSSNTKLTINWKGGLYNKSSDLYKVEDIKIDNGVNSTLILQKAKNDRALYGQYECSCSVISGVTKGVRVFIEVPPVFEDHVASVRTTEGENVTLTCNVWGFPAVNDSSVQWLFQNSSALRDGISVVRNRSRPGFSQLLIQGVSNDDRGVYTCFATNQIGSNYVSYMLRVKGRYAALWPFIGIVIQLVILVAIIVFYEWKKSQKTKVDNLKYNIDSNNEADVLGTERGNEPESVRQRLVRA